MGNTGRGRTIVRVDTIRPLEFPNLLFVRILTDSGLVGLGETFFGARAVETYVHESLVPLLIGREPSWIPAIMASLEPYVGFAGTGVEARGRSAIDIALWDLLGRTAGLPLYDLLGGRARLRCRVYNTCAGYRYVRGESGQAVANWGVGDVDVANDPGPFEDLVAFMTRPEELAQSLLDQGITGMKIWPFDPAAERENGLRISETDLRAGLEPIRRIRDAVGVAMDVMVELHGLWSPPAALRIAKALEPFEPFWIEDPLRSDDVDAIATLAAATSVPIAVGETLGGLRAFDSLLRSGAARYVTPDIGWSGGITTVRQIAAIAQARQIPVAVHDCVGPITMVAAAHLAVHLPNAVFAETVRAFYTGWYRKLIEPLPTIEDGWIRPPDGHGLGVDFVAGLLERTDVIVTSSSA